MDSCGGASFLRISLVRMPFSSSLGRDTGSSSRHSFSNTCTQIGCEIRLICEP